MASLPITTVAIIGPCGRGGIKYTKETFNKMITCARGFIGTFNSKVTEIELVSGGSSLSDHVAVRLFLMGVANRLTLYIPDDWDAEHKCFGDHHEGETLNILHKTFSSRIDVDTLDEIALAIAKGATIKVVKGFKNRNMKIAQSTVLLAFTPEGGDTPITPGTLDTWNKHKGCKICVNINKL